MKVEHYYNSFLFNPRLPIWYAPNNSNIQELRHLNN